MPIIHAIVLGLVQGLSEFLPISSSGHLLLVPWLFGWNDFDGANGESIKKTFDVALHLGTFVAVLGYFRHEVISYIREGTKLVFSRQKPTTLEGRLAWFFVLATLPAAAVGALFEDVIDEALGTPVIIAASPGWWSPSSGPSGSACCSGGPTEWSDGENSRTFVRRMHSRWALPRRWR